MRRRGQSPFWSTLVGEGTNTAQNGDSPRTTMNDDVKRLLASYPRERPPLPPALAAIYHDTYVSSREGRGILYRITQSLEAWMHRRIAADSVSGQTALEIGAGTLNHLRFEANDETYDVVEPYTALYEGRPETKRVRAFYADIAEVPRENRYDRIISIATLEHVLDLPRLVAQAATLLKPEGTFAAGIPSEGGFLWGLAWRSPELAGMFLDPWHVPRPRCLSTCVPAKLLKQDTGNTISLAPRRSSLYNVRNRYLRRGTRP